MVKQTIASRFPGILALLLAAHVAGCGGGKDAQTAGATAGETVTTPGAASADGGATAGATGVTDSGTSGGTSSGDTAASDAVAVAAGPTTTRDAVRLADQASFGPTEELVKTIQAAGRGNWIKSQLKLKNSSFTSGGDSTINKYGGSGGYCDGKVATCWRDNYSKQPLAWDFFRNATINPDQLRQRVAFALSQIVVVSNLSVNATYGLRNYHNSLLDNAFGNYRNVLRKVALSPVMGDYLNNVNNDKAAPNENFPRELLQLFSLGTCLLNPDGTLKTGACQPTYDNEAVRSYAYALTGWTYPKGGLVSWGCPTNGTNCQFYDGDMVPVAGLHDTQQRPLLSGVSVASGSTPASALESVLDSLMAHPNMAPFIGRQLIQMLVTSNPSPQYTARVAQAFTSGSYAGFGTGTRGDLTATVAAVLLDADARQENPDANFGKLREPIQMFAGVLRALNGATDGQTLTDWWGTLLEQNIYSSPSVFNFYPPDYPLARTALVGPAFAIHTTNAALNRVNYVNYLTFWNGSKADASVPNGIGTKINTAAFEASAADPAVLVDRLSTLALGRALPATSRAKVIDAVAAMSQASSGDGWAKNRVNTAAFLIFASPQYNVIR